MFKVLKIDPLKQDLCKVLDKKNDIAFNCLHGEFGESGHLPAILDYLKVPYTFSGLYPSVVTLDKIYFKSILKKLNILCPDDSYDKHPYHKNGERIFIHKKIRGGGSIGMHLAKDIKSEQGYFAEEFIEGNLLTLGILEYQGNYIPLGIVRVELGKKSFYDTQAKYETGFSKYNCYNGCKQDKIIEDAIAISSFLKIKSCARLDLIEKDDKLYYIELNTVPGLYKKSNLVFSAKISGLSFYELLIWILNAVDYQKL